MVKSKTNRVHLTFFQTDSKNIILTKILKRIKNRFCIGKGKNPFYVYFFKERIHSIKEFFTTIKTNSYNPNRALLLGNLDKNASIDLDTPKRRVLKSVDKEYGTIVDEPTPILVLDLDKVPVKSIGYKSIDLAIFNSKEFSERIVEKLFPTLSGISHVVQLSSSFGVSRASFSCHIFFLMETDMCSQERKELILSLDRGRKYLDAQVASANQIIYTANPIIGEGLDSDPLIERIFLVRGARRIPISILEKEISWYHNGFKTGRKLEAVKKSLTPLAKKSFPSDGGTISIKGKATQDLMYDVYTGKNLHQSALKLALKLSLNQGYKCCVADIENNPVLNILRDLVQSSLRMKTDPKRISVFMEGEDIAIVKWAAHIIQSSLHKFQRFLIKSKNMETFDKSVVPGKHELELLLKPQNNKYLSLDKILPSTSVMDSPMGTGKTEALRKIVELKINSISEYPARILIITPTSSLARSVSERYNAINYEDVKDDKVSRAELWNPIRGFTLVSCINSVPYLFDGNDFNDEFDLIIFEESDQIFNQMLLGPYNGDRGEYFDYICRITRKADKVVCSQFNILQLTSHFLNTCGRGRITFIENEYKPLKRVPVRMLEDKQQNISGLVTSLRKENRCLVACNTKALSLEVESFISESLPQKKTLLINSDNSFKEPQRKFLNDPNSEESRTWDCVVYTYSMGTGISIEGGHFNQVFGFYEVGGEVCTPDSFIQMLGRGRDPESITFWCSPRVLSEAKSPEQVLFEVAAHHKAAVEFTRKKYLDKKGRVTYGTSYGKFVPTDFMKLKAIALSLKQEAAQEPAQLLFSAFQEQLAKVHYVPKVINVDESEHTKVETTLKKSATNDLFRREVLGVSNITREQRSLYARTPTLTDIQVAQCQRFDMEEGLGLDLTTLKPKQLDYVFTFWKQGKGLQYIESLEEGLLSKKKTQSLVKFYLDNKPQDDPCLKLVTRWEVKVELLKKVGVAASLKNNKFKSLNVSRNREFEYLDLLKGGLGEYLNTNIDLVRNSGKEFSSLPSEISARTLSAMLKHIGLLCDSRVGKDKTRYYSLNSTRVNFLNKVLINRYEKGTGILSFADNS